MYSESRRRLLTLGGVLLTILLISLFVCLATEKLETEESNLLFARPYKPVTSVTFGDIGKLTWEDGKMKFEGDAYLSAKMFFEEYLVYYIDEYIEARMAEKIALKDQVFIVREEEGKWVIEEKEKPDYIDPIFEIDAYDNIRSRPSAFLEIVDTDVSEMIQDNRMKLIINGEIYWIRLEKDLNILYMPMY